jgi:uncharacterized membrane protein
MRRALLSVVLSLSVLLSALVAADAASYTFTIFTMPGATLTEAFGINTAGQIVGRWRDDIGGGGGFLKDGATYTTVDVPPGQPSAKTEPYAINAAGQIVGVFDEGPNRSFLATPARRSQK